MINANNSPTQQPKKRFILNTSKLLAAFGSTQLLVQFAGIVSGIMVVRLLPPEEYAFYTLALTMLGTMTILADGGVGSGVMAEGGKIWLDRSKLGQVIITGLTLRKKFAQISAIVSVPILIYLYQSHGASISSTILVIIGVLVMLTLSLSATLFEIAPKLHQAIGPLSKITAIQTVARLAILVTSLKILPVVGAAIFATIVPQLWSNRKVKKLASRYADENQLADPEITGRILKIVRRSLPESIFYCLSSQLSIWLIAIVGSTHSIAQLGALGRINQAFAIFSTFVTMILVPRFARLPEERQLLQKWLLACTVLVITVGATGVIASSVCSKWILLIIGTDYLNLEQELLLVSISAALGIITSFLFNFGLARGWIMKPSIVITTEILSKITLLVFLDVSTLRGVILFGAIGSLPTLAVRSSYLLWKTTKIPTLSRNQLRY